MSRGSRMLVVGAVTMLTAVFTAPPAGAVDSDTTSTTFTLTGGSLLISAPTSVSLGSVALGATTVSGSLGIVTVTDNRDQFVSNWAATASSTDFVTGSGTAAEKVLKALVTYTPGTATTTGTGTFTPAPVATMGATIPVIAAVASMNNSASWNPTLSIAVGGQTIAGTYTGTITHSVS